VQDQLHDEVPRQPRVFVARASACLGVHSEGMSALQTWCKRTMSAMQTCPVGYSLVKKF